MEFRLLGGIYVASPVLGQSCGMKMANTDHYGCEDVSIKLLNVYDEITKRLDDSERVLEVGPVLGLEIIVVVCEVCLQQE